MDVLRLTLEFLAFSSLLLTLLCCLSVWSVLRKAPARRREPGELPGVSILKPLAGIDEGLLENLESFALQDYPRFEIILAAEDPDDPALDTARILRAKYPSIPIRVLAGTRPLGLNPKVRNLAAMSELAKHDLLLISDSNVRAPTDYLSALVASMPPGGMVTNLIRGAEPRSLGAQLDALELHSFVAAGIAGARALGGRPCVLGKSMLLSREDLRSLGGFASVKDVLAEDYVLGAKYHQAGRQVILSPVVLPSVLGRRSVSAFFARRLRWCQLRRQTGISTYALEALMYPGAFALALAAAGAPLSLVGLLLALKLVLDAAQIWRLCGRAPSVTELCLSPLKDLLAALAWIIAWRYRRVVWRGHELIIGAGTIVTPRGQAIAGRPAGVSAP